ncbi:MAG: YfhO family protein, partial [Clostridia bacterium]|nr:YfhO family protein [Clostridia bacterium]
MNGGKTLKKKSNLNCLWAFSITAGLLLLVYVLYGLYPLGEKCILYSDMKLQYYPMLTEFYSRVKEGRGLIYSWSTGLGMPFAGNLINYLASPVNLLVLFFPKDNIYTAIALIILIKVSFASGFFTFYINKSRDTDRIFAVSLGVAYSLCGWFAAYYWDFMWLDAFALFPIVIYGIEKLIDTHKPLTYILSLALTLITSFYIGYMVCIFSVIWFLIYEFFIGKDSMLPVRHKKYFFENLIGCNLVRDGGLFAFSSLIAGGLAAFALVPVFFILTRSSATSDTWPENGELFFRFFDFLVNHLADVAPTFRSKAKDLIPTLPNIYSGILPVILSVFFFVSKNPARREKWGFGILLALMYFSMNINVLNYIWHAFHEPNDLPYRFSFMYSFLLLVISAKAFGNVRDEKIYKYAISALPVIFIALTANKYGVFGVDNSSVVISIVAAVIFCLLMIAYKYLGSFRDSVTLFIAFCMIIEVAYSGSGNYNIIKKQPEIKEEYESFQTFIEKANEQNDDDKFYRSVLSYELNDGCFGYNGINLFSSMANESVVKLQDKLGNETNNINSVNYACQTPVYNMMHAVRYLGDKGAYSPYISAFGYTKLADGFFRSDYYLPLAFGVNEELADWKLSENDVIGNQANWFNLASGTDGAFERVKSITVTGEDIRLDFDSNTGII